MVVGNAMKQHLRVLFLLGKIVLDLPAGDGGGKVQKKAEEVNDWI